MCTSGPASADGGTVESVGWVGRVDGDDGKVKKHVHGCRVQQSVLTGWE